MKNEIRCTAPSFFVKYSVNMFISIKSNLSNIWFVYFISVFLELSNNLVVTDIIFSKMRTFINFTTFIYVFNPVFYVEYLNTLTLDKSNLSNTQLNCRELSVWEYEKDQIFLILRTYHKAEVYSSQCYSNNYLMRPILWIIIVMLFVVLSIRIKSSVLKIMHKISGIILFIMFKIAFPSWLFIYNRPVISQLTDSYIEIGPRFILDILWMLIFNLLAYFFYRVLIYAYFDNILQHLVKSKLYFLEFLWIEVSSCLMTLRLNNTHSIVFQLMWIGLFIAKTAHFTFNYLFIIHKTKLLKAEFFWNSFYFAVFITRFATDFLIIYTESNLWFIVWEFILIALITTVLFYYFENKSVKISLSKWNEYLESRSVLFLYGTTQLFTLWYNFYIFKIIEKRIIEKHKENFYMSFLTDLKNYCLKTQKDYDAFDDKHNTFKTWIKMITNNKRQPTVTSAEKEYNLILQIAIKILDYIKGKIKTFDHNTPFWSNAEEVLHFYRIWLFFTTDDKTFRSEFFLKKFLFSPIYHKSSLVTHCFFMSWNNYFKDIEKKGDDNWMSYMIIFLELNNEYMMINNSFKSMLKSFTKSKAELISIIDEQNTIIGQSLEKIIKINERSTESVKLREQHENEKFKWIEDILFNSSAEKNFDYFDIYNWDTIVEKNHSFWIVYSENDFIIKRAPLLYYEWTNIKTTKMKDQWFNLIFPFALREAQAKQIKKFVLTKKTFYIDSAIEDSAGYIVGVKMHFILLPSFNGQLFIVCSMDAECCKPNNNYIWTLGINSETCIEFGSFFRDYFGWTRENKKLNWLSFFDINQYNPKKKRQTFNVNFSLMKSKFQQYYIKDTNKKKSEISSALEKIKTRFGEQSNVKIEIIAKHIIIAKNAQYNLLQFNLIDFQQTQWPHWKTNEIVRTYMFTQNNATITNSRSGSSVLSYKNFKENTAWNISSKQHQNAEIVSNSINTISFAYNLLLIMIAISISIFMKLYSNIFYHTFVKLIIIREIINQFYQGEFYVSNVINIINNYTDNPNPTPHNSLDLELKSKLGYDFDLYKFYEYDFDRSTNDFFIQYNNWRSNFTNIHANTSKLNTEILRDISIMQIDGNQTIVNFLTVFDLPNNYFFLLTKVEGFYVSTPYIPEFEIKTSIQNWNEYQKYIFILVINYYNISRQIGNVIIEGKLFFDNAFSTFRLVIIFIFIVFLVWNALSLVLWFWSIQISHRKIKKTTEKIIQLPKKHFLFLKKKVKLVKKVILNEMKTSLVIDKLKENSAEWNLKINNRAMTSGNCHSPPTPSMEEDISMLSGTNSPNNDHKDYKDDNTIIHGGTGNKQVKYTFKIFYQVMRIVFLVFTVYLIYSIITFPIIYSYFNQINIKKKETENVDDLQRLLLMFYWEIKFSIFINVPMYISNIDLFGQFTENIYNNYTSLMKQWNQENDPKYTQFMEVINGGNSCEFILRDTPYVKEMTQICDNEPITQTKVESTISSFVNELRLEMNIFNQTKRTQTDVREAFHSRSFQYNNILQTIYYVYFLDMLKFTFLLPEFEKNIVQLSNFLVIMFCIMVLTEIFNYIIGSFLVLRNMNNVLHNFLIIEKFFTCESEKEKHGIGKY